MINFAVYHGYIWQHSEHNVANPTENQYSRWIKAAAFPCSLPSSHPSLVRRAFFSTWIGLIRIVHLSPHIILASDESLFWNLFTKQCVKYILFLVTLVTKIN